jgi:Matrixin
MARFAQLVVEQLEDRLTPATFGVPWPNPQGLTVSFVPDGAAVGARTSNLFHTLNTEASTSTWEREILRALQTWAVNANINLSVVPDGRQPLGSPGAVQGDPRFGDIRIAAVPGAFNSADVADALPFSWTGSTWSGDIILNSSQPFEIGNEAGAYDLFSVLLHEAGHVFGLDDDAIDPGSAMSPTYAYHTQLASTDILHLQKLYGSRQADSLTNNTMANASWLQTSLQGGSLSSDLSNLQDLDYYRIQTPGFLTGFTGFSVQVKTSGISLLTSNLAVYDAWGRLVGSASASDPTHGDLTLNINAQPSSTYYLRVTGANSSVFGIGDYQLNVTNHYWLLSLGTILNLADGLLNTTFATADHLLSQNPGTDQRFDYFSQGTQYSSNNGEYYVVQSPSNASGASENMVALAWGLDVNGLEPRLHVFDAHQNPIAVQVIANGSQTYTIQLPKVAPGTSFYVEVTAANPSSQSTGRFALAVDFHAPSLVSFGNLTSESLTAAQSQSSGTLTLAEDEVFHFALTAVSSNVNAWLTMTIVDSTGSTVLTLKVQAGQPTVTADIFLKMGTYTVTFSGSTSDGSAWTGMNFWLDGDMISDPVGAYSTSPTSSGSTAPSSSGNSSYYTYGPPTTSKPPPPTTTSPYYY